MQRVFDPIHYLCIAIGLLGLYVNLWSDTQWMMEQTKTIFDSNVWIVITIGIAGAVSFVAFRHQFANKRFGAAICLLITWVICITFSYGASLDRVASKRIERLREVKQSVIAKMQNAIDKRTRSVVEVQQGLLEVNLTQEQSFCSKAARYGTSRSKRAREARKMCDWYRKETKLTKAAIFNTVGKNVLPKFGVEDTNTIDKEGLWKYDSLGISISYFTQGAISAKDAGMYFPALAPLAILLIASQFLAIGLAGREVKSEFDLSLTGRSASKDKARRFVQQYIAENGENPTLKQIQNAASVSLAVARQVRD